MTAPPARAAGGPGIARRQAPSSIGRSSARSTALAKVTGADAASPTTSSLPRMLHCKLLRSTCAHARIVRDRHSRGAERCRASSPSLTGTDLPDPVRHPARSRQDEHALCPDRVRFVGDPVAAVAAVDEDAAFEALDARSRSTTSRCRRSPRSRRRSRTPRRRIHDYGDDGNVHKLVSMEFGDVEEGFAAADRVLRGPLLLRGQHAPAAGAARHAGVDFEPDGKLTLWSSTQTPHYVHRALAKVLEMPPARDPRRSPTPNGGGFGGKSDPFNHEIVVAQLARMHGPAGEDPPDARGGLLLPPRPPPDAHAGRRRASRRTARITAMHFQTLLDGGGLRLLRRRDRPTTRARSRP